MEEFNANGYEINTAPGVTMNKWICTVKTQAIYKGLPRARGNTTTYTALVLAQDQWDMQAQICQLLDELNLTLIGFYNATIINAPSSRVTNNNTLTILADCLTLTNRVELAEKS